MALNIVTKKPRKHFYRCLDCLTVAVTLEQLPAIQNERGFPQYGICDACTGQVEYMGQVHGTAVYQTEHVCACDSRCTNATGPSCSCVCDGENHGTGRVVEVLKDGSGRSIPRLMTPADALPKAEAYRALYADVRAAWEARYGAVGRAKRNGEYLSSGEYARYMQGTRVWQQIGKARAMSTHAGRNKKLQALLNEIKGITAAA